MNLIVNCPACGANVFAGTEWTREEWTEFRAARRTPICAQCLRVLVLENGLLRRPTETELRRIHLDDDSIETIQWALMKRLGLLAFDRIGTRLLRRRHP